MKQMDMADAYILIGAVLIVVPLIMLGRGLSKTSARAEKQAAEHFALLEDKYKKQVRDDLRKKG